MYCAEHSNVVCSLTKYDLFSLPPFLIHVVPMGTSSVVYEL